MTASTVLIGLASAWSISIGLYIYGIIKFKAIWDRVVFSILLIGVLTLQLFVCFDFMPSEKEVATIVLVPHNGEYITDGGNADVVYSGDGPIVLPEHYDIEAGDKTALVIEKEHKKLLIFNADGEKYIVMLNSKAE